MKIDLNRLPEYVSENDMARFDDKLSHFGSASGSDKELEDRILSSVMRKAGFEMKEAMTVKKVRRHGKRFVGAMVAAAVLATGAIGAGASGSLDTFRHFFSGEVSPFESEVLSTVQTVSNDDLTLTIDGIVADEVECKILVSVYANNRDGKKIVKRLQKDPGEDEVYTVGNRQLFIEHHGYDYHEGQSYDDESLIYPSLNSSNEYHVIRGIEMSRIDLSEPFILTEQESGLSIEFDVLPYLESHRLYSDDENAFDHVVLSPMGIHIRSTQNDIDSGRSFDTINDDAPDIYVNYSDGSRIALDGVGITHDYSTPEDIDVSKDKWKSFEDEYLTNETVDASPMIDGKPSFISVDGVVSVTIDGIEYTIME